MALAGYQPPPLSAAPAAMGPVSGPPLSPTLLNLNQRYNMSASSMTELMLLLSSMYISMVVPDTAPTPIGLHAIFPKAIGDFVHAVKRPFQGRNPSAYKSFPVVPEAFNISTSFSRSEYDPHQLLNILCDDIFTQNTITVFYMNNNLDMKMYSPSSRIYLPRIVESLGLPIISYDTQFSFRNRPKLSVQLAPTMSHIIDVLFAFLRKFKWHDFSFLCTLSYGCVEELSTIQHKVDMSKTNTNYSVYGVDIYEYNLLSYVNFTDDAVEGVEDMMREKLKYELDQDTRIIFVHGKYGTVQSILDVAAKLGLTGQEYVWIFTVASVKEVEDMALSFPLGSFLIGFEYEREHMPVVVETAVNIWMDSLQRIATSKEFHDIDFRTNFSCNRVTPGNPTSPPPANGTASKSTLHWKFGELLYQKILETKLPNGVEFDKYGVVKRNRFWIKNLQRVEVTRRSSSRDRSGSGGRSPSRKPGGFSFQGGGRTSSRGSSSSSRGSPFGGRGGGRTSDRGRPTSSRTRGRGTPDTGSSSRTSSLGGRGSSSTGGRGFSFGRDRDNSRRPSSLSGSSRSRDSGSGSFRSSRDQRTSLASSPQNDEESRGSENRGQMQTPLSPGSDESSTPLTALAPPAPAHSSRSQRSTDLWRHHPLRRHRHSYTGKRHIDVPVDWQESEREKRATTEYQRRFTAIGAWDGHNLTLKGIVWAGGQSKPPKGKPEKYTLKVVTWQEEPHVIYSPMANVTKEGETPCDANSLPCKVYERDEYLEAIGNETIDMCCTGLCIDLLKRVSERLHFDVQLFEVRDDRYGRPLNDNNTDWNGMLGMVIHEEVDMAIAALAITPERSVAVDFSVPFLQTGIAILVAIREGVISATAFLEPYDYPSWMLILIFSVHATGASIFIFEWLSPYGLDQGKTPLSVHKFSLFRSFWLIWAMLFGASVSTDMPRGCASRFLANIWALFAVVFCASYTANLAAFMITKDEYYDLSGIQDWRLKNPNHRKPPFQFATINDSSTELNIKNNYKVIFDNMKKFNMNKPDVKAGIKALKQQSIQAFIYDSTTLEYEVGKDPKCKLKTVGKRIAETGYGIAFPRKSQWLRHVDRVLLEMQKEGEIERLQKFWLAGACHKKKKTGVSSHTLGILNFTSAFILLGGGVVLGVLLMVFEHMYFRFGRKSLRKWDKCGCCSLVSLSMGQSLTFERSVFEAIDYHRQHKCRDPLCETQLWKVKHELDLALIKIKQLRKQIAHSTSQDNSREISLDRDYDGDTNSPDQNSRTRRRRRQRDSDASDSPVSKPLLALEGPPDTDDDTADEASAYPKHVAKPAPTPRGSSYQNGRAKPSDVQDDPIAYENPRYSIPQKSPPEKQPDRRGSGPPSGNTPLKPTKKKKPQVPPKKVANLQLHSSPPTFEEAMTTSYPTDVGGDARSSPSPPLPPPPPTPPVRNLEQSGTGESYPSPPEEAPSLQANQNLSEGKPFKDPSSYKPTGGTTYEPVILDSPVSPSSSMVSNGTNNPHSSPGGLSQLSKDASGTSMPSSPEHLPFVAPPTKPKGASSLPKQQTPLSTMSSSDGSGKHQGQDNGLGGREADNDVSVMRARDNDGNVYVNVDEIVGKETSF